MHSLKALFALTAASALVACGGGGGEAPGPTPASAPPPAPASDAPPAPVPAPPASVGSNGTLQTSVPSAVYADTRRRDAFAQLNAVRLGAGAGLLAQSGALDVSAQDHADYLGANGFGSADSAHDETAGLPGFTGSDPFVRMQNAGYNYTYATEVIGDIGSSSPTSDCVGDLLDTVYHALSMLSRVTEVGFGYGSGATAGLCTIDMASPLDGGAARQILPSGAIVTYPFGGSTVAHGTFHVSNESPRVSSALLPAATAGVPVIAGFRNQDVVAGGKVTITRFTLAGATGANVPGVILGGSNVAGDGVNVDPQITVIDPSFAVFVPASPLAAGRYTVTLQAAVGGGRALTPGTWSFTVAAP